MKRWLAATAVAAACGLVPASAVACEYDDSSASATPPTQLGLAPAPAATKAATPVIAKAPAAKTTKQVAKTKAPAADAKLAAVTTR
jgi:hypothetical protein